MDQVTLYCPNCGTKLETDAGEAQATCSNCGTTFPIGEGMRQMGEEKAVARRLKTNDSAFTRQSQETAEESQSSEEEERRARESKKRRNEALRAWEQRQRDTEQRRLDADAARRAQEEENERVLNRYGYLFIFGVFGLMALFLLFYRPESTPSTGSGETSESPAAEQVVSDKDDELVAQEEATSGESIVSEEEPKPKEEAAEENVLLSNATWPDNDLANMMPKPEFSVPIESVEVQDDEYRCSIDAKWTGATQDEVAKYVQAVKDAGFTELASETVGDDYYNYVAHGPDSKDDSVNTDSRIGITYELEQKYGQKEPVPFTRVYLYRYLKDAKINW